MEDRLAHTAEGKKRVGQTERSVAICTLACVKWMVAERLLITQAASQSGAL